MDRKEFLKSAALGVCAASAMGNLKLEAAEIRPAAGPANGAASKKIRCEKIIFPVGREVEVRMGVPDGFLNSKKLSILCAGDDGGFFDAGGEPYLKEKKTIPFRVSGSVLSMRLKFPREQRYTFLLYNREISDIRRSNYSFAARVYALDADLYALTPFKCDFHMHSTGSDGRETPEEAGIKCLEVGLDYQSLSDHSNYSSSCGLAEKFRKFPLSMNAYFGEEIHKSEAHILSLGARGGVTDFINSNKSDFDASAKKYAESLGGTLNATERQIVSHAMAEVDVVRKLGGRPVFAHPYWRLGAERIGGNFGMGINSYLSERTVDALFLKCQFDAVEAVNATTRDEQTDLMISALSDLRAQGKDYPIIGVSDAHHPDQHGKGFTVAFARSNSFEDIWESIMNRRNTAVDSPADGLAPVILGRRRFVRFTFFLLEEYFPTHDGLCSKQAGILSAMLQDENPDALMPKLKDSADAVKNLYSSLRF